MCLSQFLIYRIYTNILQDVKPDLDELNRQMEQKPDKEQLDRSMNKQIDKALTSAFGKDTNDNDKNVDNDSDNAAAGGGVSDELPEISDVGGFESSEDDLPGPSRSSSRAGKDEKKSKDSGESYLFV